METALKLVGRLMSLNRSASGAVGKSRSTKGVAKITSLAAKYSAHIGLFPRQLMCR